jgi:hypothetical protein
MPVARLPMRRIWRTFRSLGVELWMMILLSAPGLLLGVRLWKNVQEWVFGIWLGMNKIW